MVDLQKFSDSAVLAQALAQAVAEDLRSVLAQQERAVLAVSGGKSPIAFFQALSQMPLDWARVWVSLVDERLVATDHADSNTELVRQHLLRYQAQLARFVPMVADDASAQTLNDPEQAVAWALQVYQQPDVVVLGMGADGHTASLFPQAPQLAQGLHDTSPLLHTSPITAPHERISMSLHAIEHSKAVYLSIAGTEKWAVYQQAVEQPSQNFPISFILHSQKVNAHVYYCES